MNTNETKSSKPIELKAFGDRVIIRPDPPKEISSGGIHLPHSTDGLPCEATVVSVGDFRSENGDLHPLPLNEGDRVLVINGYESSEIVINEVKLKIVSSHSILAVIQ